MQYSGFACASPSKWLFLCGWSHFTVREVTWVMVMHGKDKKRRHLFAGILDAFFMPGKKLPSNYQRYFFHQDC